MVLRLRVNTQKKVDKSSELDEELEPVSPTSEYFLSEVVTLYVLAFLELEIGINISSILTFLNDVFINIHPRLSSIVVENKKGENMWKKVAVNVEDHIKTPSFPEGLSSRDFREHFDDYVTKIATSKLSEHQPLWEVHIINCPKGHSSPGILIFKFHHAIGDGTSLMGGFLSCVKRVDDPLLPITFPSKTRTIERKHGVANVMTNTFRIVTKFIPLILYSFYDFGQGVRLLLSEDTQSPIRSGTTDMTRRCSSRVCSVTLSLNDVKKTKTLLGMTVNDIVVGVVFLGTQLYIQEVEQGRKMNTRSTASLTVNIRSVKGNSSIEELRNAKTWGNRFTIIELPLPNLEDQDLGDPLKFIQKAHKIIKRKTSGIYGPFLMAEGLHFIRKIFGVQTAAKTLARKWKNSSFSISNVIGPIDKISLANHPIKGFYFVPTGANSSLVVSVLSYVDELRLGLVVENGFIDHQRLINCVENAFQLIFQAAQATSTTVNTNVA